MKKNIQVKRSERVYASVTVRLFQILVPDIAQWVKPRFKSPFSQSLFLPSHYIWFRAKPWNWQVNSVQGKNLSWSLQISFKREECGNLNIQIAWVGYESIARLAPDQRFRGPVFKFQSGLSLFLPSRYARLS